MEKFKLTHQHEQDQQYYEGDRFLNREDNDDESKEEFLARKDKGQNPKIGEEGQKQKQEQGEQGGQGEEDSYADSQQVEVSQQIQQRMNRNYENYKNSTEFQQMSEIEQKTEQVMFKLIYVGSFLVKTYARFEYCNTKQKILNLKVRKHLKQLNKLKDNIIKLLHKIGQFENMKIIENERKQEVSQTFKQIYSELNHLVSLKVTLQTNVNIMKIGLEEYYKKIKHLIASMKSITQNPSLYQIKTKQMAQQSPQSQQAEFSQYCVEQQSEEKMQNEDGNSFCNKKARLLSKAERIEEKKLQKIKDESQIEPQEDQEDQDKVDESDSDNDEDLEMFLKNWYTGKVKPQNDGNK